MSAPKYKEYPKDLPLLKEEAKLIEVIKKINDTLKDQEKQKKAALYLLSLINDKK